MLRNGDGAKDTRTKRTTSSAASMDPERIRKAKDIRSRTLMLKLDPAGKPYSRLDVVLALATTALFKDNFDCLECLGPLSRNAEWYITLSNEESKLKIINEVIKVNGKYGHFLPAGTSEYRARIHWLPRWIDNSTLWEALQNYKGLEVKQITSDKSTINLNPNINLRHSFIGPRSVIIRTDKIDNIPHIIKIKDPIFGEEREALVTVPHRPPLCLRCKQAGHMRAECATPYCTGCRQFGHREPECKSTGTYARAAGSAAPVTAETADMDEEVINITDKDSDKEEPMELPIPNPIITPVITGNSEVTKPVISEGIHKNDENVTERIETEDKIKQSNDTVAVKTGESDTYPMVINQTPTTSSWADEISDKDLGQWETPPLAERRRRRQEKRPRERASSASTSLRRDSQSPKPRIKKK